MIALFKKEIQNFFSSLIGYVVIAVFLLMTGLVTWVFPGNVLDSGYSSLSPLFSNGPLVFMFLIPAVTMRTFSEEKRTGTIELLYTFPISDLQIVLAKYFASVALILISLLPTITYYFSVYYLGNPVGNIDSGGFWGSFIGLFLLGSGFAAIGIFASSISKNQIVSFLIAMFLSYFLWIGLEQLGDFNQFGTLDSVFITLGINEHYNSLSRGVIDTRDVIYFFTLISVFILMTKVVLQSRNW